MGKKALDFLGKVEDNARMGQSNTRRELNPSIRRILRGGRRLPRWLEAERYFRTYRDTKAKVTLARVPSLEKAS